MKKRDMNFAAVAAWLLLLIIMSNPEWKSQRKSNPPDKETKHRKVKHRI